MTDEDFWLRVGPVRLEASIGLLSGAHGVKELKTFQDLEYPTKICDVFLLCCRFSLCGLPRPRPRPSRERREDARFRGFATQDETKITANSPIYFHVSQRGISYQ